MDKQYDLLKLIVQKMEIVTEADDYDEGEEDLTGRKRPTFQRLSVYMFLSFPDWQNYLIFQYFFPFFLYYFNILFFF